MPAAESSVEVNVPPAALMAVITDFARYPEFLPEMVEATVLSHTDRVWTVRFAVRVIRKLEYTLKLVQDTDLSLSWTLVDGVFRSNNGGWTLEALAGGTRTRAAYRIDLDVGMFVPGSVLKTLVGQSLPATLEAFRKRAESR